MTATDTDPRRRAPPIESVSAVTLATADMSRAVDFYRRLGFGLTKGGAGAAFTTLDAGGQSLNLTAEAGTGAPGWWGRVIFHVADVDASYRHVLAQGVTPEFPPRDAPWGERYFHMVDPDGHEISFARPLE
ncbi:VOC family protein [Thalassobaculum sp.]|uniref:VOC family protein n=1 Tax=Thalassobaculum sp. TaxID=2022740 RepID=UPI0032F06CBC